MRVAIVGASGAVGQEFLNLIEERNFPFANLKMLASKRSAGKKIQFMGKEYTVEETTENSFEGVFKGAKWVVIGNADNSEAQTKLLEIIKFVGAKPVFASAKEHDKAAAMISHMPMVIAQALVLAAKDNPLAIEMAASGFKDMTRLALSNQEMACDMVSINHENIEQAILKLYKSVGELLKGDYPKTISKLNNFRSKMYK